VIWHLSPRTDPEALGLLPALISERDPRKAAEQLAETYAHGGGWTPVPGWSFDHETLALRYPGDPVMKPIAAAELRDELLLLYPHAFLLVLDTETETFEVARVD
jgi:hypothetical protein